MLFFTRAFICIGAIVVLAEGFGPADFMRLTRDAPGALAPAALEPVAALCRTKPDTCMAIATAALGAAPGDEPEAAAPAARPPTAPHRRGAGRPAELSSRASTPR